MSILCAAWCIHSYVNCIIVFIVFNCLIDKPMKNHSAIFIYYFVAFSMIVFLNLWDF